MMTEGEEDAPVFEHDLPDSDGNGGVEFVDTVLVNNSDGGFEAMEMDEQGLLMEERDFLFEKQQENIPLDMNDASVLYHDFASLPCTSSSSSSPPVPAAVQAITATPSSSSSPDSSWAVPKGRKNLTEAEYAAVSSTTATDVTPSPSDLDSIFDADCINTMENLGYSDLNDSNEFWDPTLVFENQEIVVGQEAPPKKIQCQEENDAFSFLRGNKELSMIFLDWLKQNKDYISAEDVRKIKLNRSTIENASKRFARTKEGMKRLLKLILEWVERYQLQKNGSRRTQSQYQYQESPVLNPTLNPNSNFSYINVVSPDNSNPFPTVPCIIPVPTPQVLESTTLVAAPPGLPPLAVGYNDIGGATYSNPPLPMPPAYHHHHQMINMMPNQMMNNAQAWTAPPYPIPLSSQFSHSPDNVHPVSSNQQVFLGEPYQNSAPNGEILVRLGSSATKEARKKRMARQKRLYSNHHHHVNHKNQMDCFHSVGDVASPPEDWMYLSVGDSASTPPTESGLIPSVEDVVKQAPVPAQDVQGESYLDQRQNGCSKTERNLKFLLQKVLKQSDVGNLGRIVLPKKEAENHLPELETRDEVTIAMEDIGASRVWNMRYRFWPNNKSRMYLLENTGDFVKVNGLQEGDFIVIYLDTNCGKYMIRGVKVRQPETNSDAKKPTARENARNLARARNRSSQEKDVT